MLPGRSLMRSQGNLGPRRMFASRLERAGDRTRLTEPLRRFSSGYRALAASWIAGQRDLERPPPGGALPGQFSEPWRHVLPETRQRRGIRPLGPGPQQGAGLFPAGLPRVHLQPAAALGRPAAIAGERIHELSC